MRNTWTVNEISPLTLCILISGSSWVVPQDVGAAEEKPPSCRPGGAGRKGTNTWDLLDPRRVLTYVAP